MNYLISHYKGKYRLLCPYDLKTNQYPRKLDGSYEDIDVYISCYNNIKIFYFGKSILEAYIPSLVRGRNIIKQINEIDSNIIQNIVETDSEIIFKYHQKYMDLVEKYLKPKTNGANISPFSSKNLPKNRNYKIPEAQLKEYKNITAKIPLERVLTITHTTNNFLKSITTKKNTWDSIRDDMRQRGLKGKEYIHSIGKWREYLNYLSQNLEEKL